jgi:hypothetical protein
VIRVPGHHAAYLVFGDTLYAFPDSATLDRCLGGYPRVRQVPALPPWPRRRLPSVRTHRWLGGPRAVKAGDPGAMEQNVSVGCVLAPVPDPATFHTIFGHTGWDSSAVAPNPLLQRMPRTEQAGPFRLRPAGTLIQGPGDSIRWVAYHGGALMVPDVGVLATYCRTVWEAERVSDDEFHYYQSSSLLPPASAPCAPERNRQSTDPPVAPRWRAPGAPPAPVTPPPPTGACPRAGKTVDSTGIVAIYPVASKCLVRRDLTRDVRLRLAPDSAADVGGVTGLPPPGDDAVSH